MRLKYFPIIMILFMLILISIPVRAVNNELNYKYSPFSGMPVNDISLQKAIMAIIENSPPARPQSGLNDASIIYEFLVEGGITRFLTLYWENVPDKIGPIRSARPYLVETANSYNPLLLHAGASPDGFAKLSELNLDNLDQIYNGSYYWRGSQRKIPHNLYTGYFKIKNYIEQLTGQEYEPRFEFQSISFVNPNQMKAIKINIDYWGNYSVHYKYQPHENNYLRYLNDFDSPHLSARGPQLKANNIIVQFANTKAKDNQGRLSVNIFGEGKALIFRDGIVIKGSWKKEDNNWTKFYDQNDNLIKLNPGKTWIQIVPTSAKVTYKGSDSSE